MSTQDSDFQELIDAMKLDKEGGGKSKKFWSPASDKEGTFPIRFLPPVKKNGEKVFYFHHKTHWIDGKSYECLKQSLTDKAGNFHEAEDCPVCAFTKKLFNTSEKGSEDWNVAYDLAAKDRYVYRIIVRGSDKETKPEFFESGKKLFGTLFHILTETDFGNILDLKEGRDFNLVKKGIGRRSNYDTSNPSAHVTPVFKNVDQIKEMIANLESMNFNQLVEFQTADAMKSALKAFLSDGSDPEPAAPVAPAAARVAQTKPAATPVSSDDEKDDVDKLLEEFEL